MSKPTKLEKLKKLEKEKYEVYPDFSKMSQNEIHEYIVKFINRSVTSYQTYRRIGSQNREDFKQALFVRLAERYSFYDHTRGTFGAFAYGEVRNLFRKAAIKQDDVIDKRTKPRAYSYKMDQSKLIIEDLMLYLNNNCSTTHKDIFFLKYIKGLTLEDISKESKVSYKQIDRYLNEIKEIIKTQYE